ncbi:MAG: hypothetical protein BGO77_04330 [Caedibacter sp. 37-49]|nr:MAG: hypothetical protein BGO77_04330 [Caedibacter sp. 37-49]
MKKKDFQSRSFTTYSPLKELIFYIKPYSFSFLKTFFALCCTAFSILAIGPSLRFLIDNGLQTGNLEFLNKAVSILIVLSLILAFSAYIRLSSTALLAEQIVTDLRKNLFAHLLKLDASFFDKTRLGDLIARLSDDCTLLKTILSMSGAIVIRGFIQFLGALIFMLFTSLKLTFFTFLIIPIASLPIWLLGRRLKQKTLQSQNSQGNLTTFVNEHLSSITTIQAFTQEEFSKDQFTTLNKTSLQINTENLKLRACLISLVIGGVLIAISIVLNIGGHAVLAKNLSSGSFLSFLFYALVAAGSLNEIAEVLGDFQKAASAMGRLLEILKTPSKIDFTSSIIMPSEPLQGYICFRNISFSYPTRPQIKALKNFSGEIKKGEKIAIVGASGAGKSTLFKLLMRFYDLEIGSIQIDGYDITKLNPKILRQAFSVVFQDTTIFHDTVYQNIAFARPEATRQEILNAAQAAYVDEFASHLPQGFETIVGDQGKQLSGGQRQRIAIARALLKNAPILLLDEATNALDSQSESFVQKAIGHLAKDRTTIIIAHRLTTIKECDQIFVMDKGKLIEQGTHQTLLKADGLYKRFYNDSCLSAKKNSFISA